MSPQPRDPNLLLSRVVTAEALSEVGYVIKPKTLATMATRGGGPPYHKWSKIALYKWDDALQWAQARLSGPHSNTSTHDASTRDHVSSQTSNRHLSHHTDRRIADGPANRPAGGKQK
jgi:hypothetical protein